MRLLSRVPFWGWLLFLTIFSYLVWNPTGFSVAHMWIAKEHPLHLSAMILITVIVFGILYFFFRESQKSIGNKGLLFLVFLFALVMWFFYDMGVWDPKKSGKLAYIAPFICALFLTIGSQFNKVRRSISGTVSVDHTEGDVVDTVDHHHDEIEH